MVSFFGTNYHFFTVYYVNFCDFICIIEKWLVVINNKNNNLVVDSEYPL